jgi:twitching motility protein PilT
MRTSRGTAGALFRAMAAVDALLRLIAVRNAELLVIASGQVPQLRRAGETAPLSMPALDAVLVRTMVGEVLDEVAQARLASSGTAEATYQLGDGHAFALLIEARDGGFRMSCRPASAAPPPRQAPVPLPVPLPVPDLALKKLLDRVERDRASDLILSTGQLPRMRVGGDLVEIAGAPIGEHDLRSLVRLDAAHERQLAEQGSVDLALEINGARFRVNVFRQRAGLAAALRPIRRVAPTLEELDLPADLHDLTRHSSGLVLMTGRAGSGKSTTLVALIDHLNRTRQKHIITLEDPIEYEYQPARCLIHQREIGAQVDSFATGLRAALRESPDIILVGEMRDRDTIAAALTAAETGHLVLATMHCASAAAAVDRIIDVFPENQQQQVRLQVALALRAVVTQVLVHRTGTAGGLVPAHEKMVVTSAVAAQIREGKVHQIPSLIQTGRDAGMVPLERSLAALVRAGKVTRAAAREAAHDPAALDAQL